MKISINNLKLNVVDTGSGDPALRALVEMKDMKGSKRRFLSGMTMGGSYGWVYLQVGTGGTRCQVSVRPKRVKRT